MKKNVTESKIDSVKIFKNGLTVVRGYVSPDNMTTCIMHNISNIVHGTFWLEDSNVEIALIRQEENETTSSVPDFTSIESIFGNKVRVVVSKNNETSEMIGVILGKANPNDSMMVMRLENNVDIVSFDIKDMKECEFFSSDKEKISTKDYLSFSNYNDIKPIFFNYLTTGLVWAPSYSLSFIEGEQLEIRLQGVVKNNYKKLNNVDVGLISGYPNIQFGGVSSLLTSNMDGEDFFNQLEESDDFPRRFSSQKRMMMNRQVASNVIRQGVYRPHFREQCEPEAYLGKKIGSSDLHTNTIGRKSLDVSEAIQVELAVGVCEVNRVVDWFIPDARNIDGRTHQRALQWRSDPDFEDQLAESVWDTAQFRNPFDIPLTTAPAQIIEYGQFKGQSSLFWTNPGDQAFVRITKALSFRTQATEEEEPDSRDIINWGGNQFQSTNVKGSLRIENGRSEVANIIVRRRFTGKLIEADLDPQNILHEDGVILANSRNELHWRFELAPHEEKEISYRYNVLVLNEKN